MLLVVFLLYFLIDSVTSFIISYEFQKKHLYIYERLLFINVFYIYDLELEVF